MTDRVSERRRAAQLARHYRDQEGLTIAEIARRLGRAEGTVKAYLYDPMGDKAREVKARYRGVCRGCGAPTSAQWQGRRVCLLQALPSGGDRAAMDPRAGP
jgi:transcriptional regulator with XRE-family HTH domain